ncbi:MAG: hypothetical protein M1836_006068 [Candelina mexicana]|nr:MAG: hypothetical protein M1836_006068 [Candelina mexicana]
MSCCEPDEDQKRYILLQSQVEVEVEIESEICAKKIIAEALTLEMRHGLGAAEFRAELGKIISLASSVGRRESIRSYTSFSIIVEGDRLNISVQTTPADPRRHYWETATSGDEDLPSTSATNNSSTTIEDTVTEQTPDDSQDAERIELLAGVERFAEEYKLQTHLPILQAGALIAQDASLATHIQDLKRLKPDIYGNVHTPTEHELAALEDEKDNIWHHRREIPKTIILGSIAAAVQGWDQTGSNGANIWFPQVLCIPPSSSNTPSGSPKPNRMCPPSNPGVNDWLIGLINAAPYISAGLLGCWLADPLNFYFGRRGCIFFAAIFCILPIIGSACSQTWAQLFVCRLLLGIGMGAKATTVPIYMAEISPKRIRGALVMSWQTCVAFGLVLGFSANLAVSKTGDIAWRLQFGSAFLPALPILLGIYWCPESPRYYMKKSRYGDALRSLQRLRTTDLQAARDVYYIYRQLTGEVASQESSFRVPALSTPDEIVPSSNFNISQTPLGLRSYFTRFKELFVKNRVRQATLAATTVMLAQQACGINIISFYSSTIFKSTPGVSDMGALWCSWGFGLCNFLFALPALLVIDQWGRRTLLLYTFPQLAWTLLAAGLCSLVPDKQEKAKLGLVTFFIFLYTAFYSTGEGPVPFTYSAEVFPLSHRELGMSLAVSVNLTFAAILSLTFPSMVAAFHTVGAFGFYAYVADA